MATVTLGNIWLNDGGSPSDHLEIESTVGDAQDVGRSVDGGVEKLAGGRFRSVYEQGVAETWAISVELASWAEIQWIQAHIGRSVWVRDRFGRRVFGSYGETSTPANPYVNNADISFTVTSETPPVI